MTTTSTLNVRIKVMGLFLASWIGAAHLKRYGDPDRAAHVSGRFMFVLMKPPGGRWQYAGRVTKNKEQV